MVVGGGGGDVVVVVEVVVSAIVDATAADSILSLHVIISDISNLLVCSSVSTYL